MKFFDPKKKEQNPSTYPPPAPTPVPPSPVVQPAPATPTSPAVTVPPAPLPRPPAPPSPDAGRPSAADTAPTVMIPAPGTESPAPPAPVPAAAPVPVPEPPTLPPAPAVSTPAPPQKPALVTQRLDPQHTGQTLIGSTVMIKGDLTANESILVDGFVEGSMETTGDVHVGLHGKAYASVRADNIRISGKVVGNITASNKVELESTAVLEGNIRSPRLSISESALFRGSIDMRPLVTKEAGDDTQKEKKPASSPSLEPA